MIKLTLLRKFDLYILYKYIQITMAGSLKNYIGSDSPPQKETLMQKLLYRYLNWRGYSHAPKPMKPGDWRITSMKRIPGTNVAEVEVRHCLIEPLEEINIDLFIDTTEVDK